MDTKYQKNLDKLRDKLDTLISEHEDIGASGESAAMESEAIKQWLDDNSRIVKLTALIPQAKKAEGELAYITLGQYRNFWHKEPPRSILTPDGKRVRWEYALDDFAMQLGLQNEYGHKADEALRDLIHLAVEYKHKLRTLKGKSASSDDEYKESKKAIENLSIEIGRREQVADIQDDRSDRAKAIDSSKQAKEVLYFPNVQQWLSKPSRHDIRGVDTKRKHKAISNKISGVR